ncbi:MAG: hypothetical protein NVS9B7_12140 [Flavisolibacter sp.]
MGVWALFLVITTIFETTKSYLLKNAHIKFVSSFNDNPEKTIIASSSLLINALISILFIFFIIFFSENLSHWLHSGVELAQMLKWFIPGLICMILFSHFEAIQQSHFDFKGVFAGYLVRQFVFFLIIFFQRLLKIPFTLSHIAFGYGVSILVGTIFIYLFSRKYLLYRFNPTKEWVKKIIGFGGYIFGSGIVTNIFVNLDQLMTAKFIGSGAPVASYNAALRINSLIDIPSYAAAEILFPKVSQTAGVEGMGKVKYIYERMVGILLSVTTPATLFIFCFPGFVISIIAGHQYAEAAPILQLYMITGLLRPAQNQAASIMASVGKPKLVFIMNSCYLLINLLLNYICLVHFGFYGAAIGTVITTLLGMLAWYLVMKQQIGLQGTHIIIYMVETYKMMYSLAYNLFIKKKQVQT